MQIGIAAAYDGTFRDTVEEVVELEAIGLDVVYVPEAYSFDAVSQLGYLAARTSRVRLASGILPIYSRTPALTAMTAAGLDFVSDGRFTLGLGASGPQVIEGFHGLPYDAPLQRTREVIEICRKVWARERVEHAGKKYTIPLPADQGTGLGKSLKLINTPVRSRIPVLLAALGPKNVELAAEVAEGWEPVFFHPERAHLVWGEALAASAARRDPELGPLDVAVNVPVAVGEGAEALLDRARPNMALYIGGMGARGKNFYNNLATRYGYGDEAAKIQDLYLAGRKAEAEAAVPEELLRSTTLIGSEADVSERLRAFAAAGVTTINVAAVEDSREGRLASVEALLKLAR
ncbi:LLM class F420-dependent oxidoreductase [Nocardioides speluncae]|uniref:LLM class F420-dependent oxidoreductase n=1 Tax=Nocardioides speluncae TaxID=2670337 RepID=UPI000D68EADA|nr:LLM class F420-dependent oxidoreductase [Nocardioides speluncae]